MVASVIDVDLADVFKTPDRKGFLFTLAWGDEVDVVEATASHLRINTVRYEENSDGSILPVLTEAYICPRLAGMKPGDIVVPRADNRVLKVDFIDVQQGDGAVIESPDGKTVLVDGGDNQLFARYLAARFPGTSKEQPKEIDCIVVTHGDADHFAGLAEIQKSETHAERRKRLFITPRRVLHNGIVKRPSKDAGGKAVREAALLGATTQVDGATILVDLVDDLLAVPEQVMNRPFKQWKKALEAWNKRGAIEFRRVVAGDAEAFSFLEESGVQVSVFGPLETRHDGVPGLRFLGSPAKAPRTGVATLEADADAFKGLSADHTINGHSIVFRMQYGACSFLFTGDLNEQASHTLVEQHKSGAIKLRSEIFKAPHHGSADFSGGFLSLVSPVVSIVSSGDESAKKEYIHPRANLLGALGRHSRIDEPLIFVTELVAFFKQEGWASLTDEDDSAKRGEFYAFSRSAYGMVRTRTDGKRLLVLTNSGKADMKEAYCYQFDSDGVPVPSRVRRA